MPYIFAVTIIFLYVLMQTFLSISIASKVSGRLAGRLALGTTMQQTIIVGSSASLIVILPLIGFLIESGMSLNTYLIIVTTSLFLSFLTSLFVIFRLNTFQGIFQKIFLLYDDNHNIPLSIIKGFLCALTKCDFQHHFINRFSFDKLIVKKVVISMIAYSFISTGFLVAFLLSIQYPDYRLTMSQFNTAFQGIGAFMAAFYIEPMLSRSIDIENEQVNWVSNIYSVIFGRVLSYLITCLLFLFILVYNL